jgi:YegS/Rv2252/BmrU family lipid kinase
MAALFPRKINMSERRTLVIVNPQSAAGRARREWPNMSRLLRGQYGTFEERFTTRPGEATDLCRQGLQEGFDAIIAVGGDGTLNEVGNGFFHPPQPGAPLKLLRPGASLGLLPFGTGGDFRKSIDFPQGTSRSARALVNAVPRAIDVGRVDLTNREGQTISRAFLNIASFGLSGLVDENVEKGPKWMGGKASFFLASVRSVASYTPQPVRLILDGAELYEGPIYLVAVSNGQYFGGGMWVAPEADLEDGLFDVVVVRGMPKARWFLRGSSIYSGAHRKMPEVSIHRGKKLVAEPLRANDPVRIDLDGEQPGALSATFEVFPKLLPVLAPPR